MITDRQVREALEANAERGESGRWGFRGSFLLHEETSALAIVRGCLIMGVRVSDVITGDLFGAIASRIADIERRLSAVEEHGGVSKP